MNLLSRAFADHPPDFDLFETLSLERPSLFSTVQALLDVRVPVWLSFRRCRQGLCGVFGQHWGGPEGDTFGRAARRFEEMGVDALLVNCIPRPRRRHDVVPAGVTDMPLGVYPNLGYLTADAWYFDPGISGEVYGELAPRWRDEQLTSHRPLDCCGRDAVDHMLGRLPAALASDGVAYVLHLSILSQRRTMELLAQHGPTCSIADFEFFPITEHFAEAMPQIEKVIAQSDSHLLDIGGRAIVAYLLEVRHA